jgi:hypothetical protein
MSSDPSTEGGVAYLVLAHHRPQQVACLARRILELSPRATVLIHWDGDSDGVLPPDGLPARASVLPTRVECRWGTWSLVEASLALLAEARAGGAAWSVLISGEDWPVVDLARWEAQLQQQPFDAILEARPLRDRWAAGERSVPVSEDEVRRYGRRWSVLPVSDSRRRDRLRQGLVRRLERRSTSRRGPAVMDFYARGVAVSWRSADGLPPGWKPFKGHQWVTVNARAVDALLSAPDSVTRHFRQTLIPDEGFVPTVLSNTPHLRVRRGLTSYAPWSHFGRTPHLVLQQEDLREIEASEAPFARKVGAGEHAGITAQLDVLSSRAWDA